jgi:LacI family transcriptional regulator
LAYHVIEGDEYGTDGLILMGGGVRQTSRLVQSVIERQLPAVALSRNWSHVPISTVSQDHYQQTQLALDHLISLGHRKIAFVARETDQDYDWYEPRLRCYLDSLSRCNPEVNPDWISLYTDASNAVEPLLARCPEITAIFAINDRRAMDILTALRALNLRVPQDISVIGLDNSIATPDGDSQVTRVAFPDFKVGYLAADLLLRQINQSELYYSNILVRSYLLEGGTCDVPRQDKI